MISAAEKSVKFSVTPISVTGQSRRERHHGRSVNGDFTTHSIVSIPLPRRHPPNAGGGRTHGGGATMHAASSGRPVDHTSSFRERLKIPSSYPIVIARPVA